MVNRTLNQTFLLQPKIDPRECDILIYDLLTASPVLAGVFISEEEMSELKCKKCGRIIYQYSCQGKRQEICHHCEFKIPKDVNIGVFNWREDNNIERVSGPGGI